MLFLLQHTQTSEIGKLYHNLRKTEMLYNGQTRKQQQKDKFPVVRRTFDTKREEPDGETANYLLVSLCYVTCGIMGLLLFYLTLSMLVKWD